ncbi:hypothetical protein D3C81_389290 [compost metagenome]
MNIDKLKLAYRDKNTNIWLVRASGGKFVEHFRQNSLVSIGHLDDVYEHSSGKSEDLPVYDEVQRLIKRKAKYSKIVEGTKNVRKLNGSGTKKLHQFDTFASKIKVGDLIVSADGDALIVGVCSSAAYLDSSPVVIDQSPEQKALNPAPQLNHLVRREVVWGPKFSRSKLPNAVKKTLQGQQTIIDLRKHWDKFYHLIYPFFVDEHFLYISNKITTRNDVNNLLVAGLLQNISLMQQFAKEIEISGVVDLNSIRKLLNFEIGLDVLSSTTKAEFGSPGDLWSRIPLNGFADKAQAAILCVALTLILAGHAQASDFDTLPSNPVAVDEKITPSDMVKDIFRAPKKKVEKQSEAVRSISKNSKQLHKASVKRNSDKIQSGLALSLPLVDTRAIEDFQFGIPAIRVFGDPNNGK